MYVHIVIHIYILININMYIYRIHTYLRLATYVCVALCCRVLLQYVAAVCCCIVLLHCVAALCCTYLRLGPQPWQRSHLLYAFNVLCSLNA